MKHYLVKTEIVQNKALNDVYYLLEVRLPASQCKLWTPRAGMFLQIKSDAPEVLLRRPLSIAYYHKEEGILGILIQKVGKATHQWSQLPLGSMLNIIGPLGNSFTTDPAYVGKKPLLVAGGVGVAPMRMLAEELSMLGIVPTIFYGARNKELLVFTKEMESWGQLKIATEDGSIGVKGFVTSLPEWENEYSVIYTCGPRVMMNAVMKLAKERKISCEVSLENLMACGIGACLCCVEKTTKGHVCVCQDGPVMNADKLIV